MDIKHSPASKRLLFYGEANQSKYSAVRPAKNYGQLAEILVQGHQRPALFMSYRKNLLIARVILPIARPDNVMPGSP